MTILRVAVLALALAACTYDLELGSRPCDATAGEICACTDTADCPDNFYCMPEDNNAGGNRTCEPPPGCTVNAGSLDCPNAGCNPANDPNCVPAEPCNANLCADNSAECCANDNRCYPASCVGCCTNG